MNIYAFRYLKYPDTIKIGMTMNDAKTRVKQQQYSPCKFPEYFELETDFSGAITEPYEIISEIWLPYNDSDIHKKLLDKGYSKVNGEWFNITPENLKEELKQIELEYKGRKEKEEQYRQRKEERKIMCNEIINTDKVYTVELKGTEEELELFNQFSKELKELQQNKLEVAEITFSKRDFYLVNLFKLFILDKSKENENKLIEEIKSYNMLLLTDDDEEFFKLEVE